MTILGKKNVYDSKIDLAHIYISKKNFEKVLFLREVMGKIVYFSPNAVNGMLTSHCDNLSTHHYDLKYHHCFDTLIRYDETTQQYFRAVSADHIDQKAI